MRIKKLFLILCYLFSVNCYLLFSLSLDETLNTLSAISPNQSAEFRWDPLFQDGVFNLGDNYCSFSAASKEGEQGFLLINNRELFNTALPYNQNGRLIFPDAFVSTLKTAFTRLRENEAGKFRVGAIIIDPGHGGRDPGTIGALSANGRNVKHNEKDIVLRVALSLRDKLIETYPDKRILMTRSTDVYHTLDYRAEMANAVTVKNNESVIFISIHANWGANTNARGYEVWHITNGKRRSLIDSSKSAYPSDVAAILNTMLNEEYNTESILLADSILQGFQDSFGNTLPSRGRKANDWFVVKNSRMPAVLVELGFVSNRQDLILMTSADGLQKFTNSLYNGVRNFIGIFER